MGASARIVAAAVLLVILGSFVPEAVAGDVPCVGQGGHCFHDPGGYPCIATPDGGTCRYCEGGPNSAFCELCEKEYDESANCACYDLECEIVWGGCGQAGDSMAYVCWYTYDAAARLAEGEIYL